MGLPEVPESPWRVSDRKPAPLESPELTQAWTQGFLSVPSLVLPSSCAGWQDRSLRAHGPRASGPAMGGWWLEAAFSPCHGGVSYTAAYTSKECK